ncbi:hypothetical protein V1506DRAFT_27191 [Lipomyces tetrasporus]
MYYHFAILLLFRPLIKLRIVGSKVSPGDVCSQAADAIQGLLTSYTRLYTLQLTPGAFVPDFALNSSIMHHAVGAVSVQTGALESEQDTTVKIDRHVSDILRQGVAGHDRAHDIVTEAIASHRHWFAAVFGGAGSAVFPFIIGAMAESKSVWVLQPLIVALISTMVVMWVTVPTFEETSLRERILGALTGRKRHESEGGSD